MEVNKKLSKKIYFDASTGFISINVAPADQVQPSFNEADEKMFINFQNILSFF